MNMSDKSGGVISPETLKTEYVSPAECVFFYVPGGFLGAKIKGEEHKRVILTRAMPLSMPGEYICITDVDKKELGIIESVSTFDDEQRKLIEAELDQRYFCPVITKIKSIREKFGNFYFDVLIGDYKKSFTVKDLSKSIRYHGKGFDLIDVDGNRYTVNDFEKTDSKSRRKLEPYLY